MIRLLLRTSLLLAVSLFAVGCEVGSTTQQSQDPFCTEGQCPANGYQPISTYEHSPEVNIEAALEEKTGNCVRCPQVVQVPQFIPQPSVVSPQPIQIEPLSINPERVSGVTKDERPREGAFMCFRCGRRTVGAEFKELWADDGTSLTCLCQQCWRSMSVAEKRSQLERYVKQSKLSESQKFHADQAIREATNEK